MWNIRAAKGFALPAWQNLHASETMNIGRWQEPVTVNLRVSQACDLDDEISWHRSCWTFGPQAIAEILKRQSSFATMLSKDRQSTQLTGRSRAARVDQYLLNNFSIGIGVWHVVDGVFSHCILGIYRVRMDVEGPFFRDFTRKEKFK